MNNTTNPVESAPAESQSSLSTLEIVIGLFALLLALAAVVVAIIQLHRSRPATQRHQQPEPEVGQITTELSTIANDVANAGSIGSNIR